VRGSSAEGWEYIAERQRERRRDNANPWKADAEAEEANTEDAEVQDADAKGQEANAEAAEADAGNAEGCKADAGLKRQSWGIFMGQTESWLAYAKL